MHCSPSLLFFSLATPCGADFFHFLHPFAAPAAPHFPYSLLSQFSWAAPAAPHFPPWENGNGRGPDAGRTIEFEETEADRTQTGRGRGRFSQVQGSPMITHKQNDCRGYALSSFYKNALLYRVLG
eukprot:gene23514-biopygen7301